MKISLQILIILLIIIKCNQTDPKFIKRSTNIDFGQDILKIKYSYDNQLLMVIRKNTETISLYDGRNFNFLKDFTLDGSFPLLPVDFQFVDDYLVIAGNQKSSDYYNVFIYQRKHNTQQIVFQKTFTTHTSLKSSLKGLKFQKLNSQYLTQQVQNKNLQTNKIKHLAIWTSNQYQIYQYNPNSSQIFSFIFYSFIKGPLTNSTYKSIDFFDEMYLLINYQYEQKYKQNPSLLITWINDLAKGSIINNSTKAIQFKANTDDMFLMTLLQDRIQQINHQRDGNLIIQAENLTDVSFTNLFYDDARLVGFFKPNNILIYRVDNAGDNASNVKYSLRFQQTQTQNQSISLAIISPNSGQLLLDNCKPSCFSYYSICPTNSYYENTKSSQACVSCLQRLCDKCINNVCSSCVQNYFVSNERCLSCGLITPGCKSCSPNVCLVCDIQLYRIATPDQISSKCLCKLHYRENKQFRCVVCPQVSCLDCIQNNICQECDQHNGWQLKQNKCVCGEEYYLNGDKCGKCADKINGCLTCNNADICTQCQDGFRILSGSCKEDTSYYVLQIIGGVVLALIAIIVVYKICKKRIQPKRQLLMPQQRPANNTMLSQQPQQIPENQIIQSALRQNPNNIFQPQQQSQIMQSSSYRSSKSNTQNPNNIHNSFEERKSLLNNTKIISSQKNQIRKNKMKLQIKEKYDDATRVVLQKEIQKLTRSNIIQGKRNYLLQQ